MTDEDKEAENYGVAPISKIVKKMKKEYDKDKKDWRVISSPDKNGNYDTFINKKPNSYWLKSKLINPYSSLSMGTIVRNIDKDIDDTIGRKMSSDDLLRLFGMIVPIKQDKSIVAAGIEKYSPQHGNYIKKVISEQDPNIDYLMSRKIDKQFIKRYPQRKGLYI